MPPAPSSGAAPIQLQRSWCQIAWLQTSRPISSAVARNFPRESRGMSVDSEAIAVARSRVQEGCGEANPRLLETVIDDFHAVRYRFFGLFMGSDDAFGTATASLHAQAAPITRVLGQPKARRQWFGERRRVRL